MSNTTTPALNGSDGPCNEGALKKYNYGIDFIWFRSATNDHHGLDICCSPARPQKFGSCTWCEVPQAYQFKNTITPTRYSISNSYVQCLERMNESAVTWEFVKGGPPLPPAPSSLTSPAMSSACSSSGRLGDSLSMNNGFLGLLALMAVMIVR